MKKIIVLAVFTFVSLFFMACGGANANGTTSSISSGLEYDDLIGFAFYDSGLINTQVEAGLQEALAKAGFVHVRNSHINYKATTDMNSEKDTMTFCVTSSINVYNVTAIDEKTILPGGCVVVTQKEIDPSGTIKPTSSMYLPKAAEKMAALLKSEVNPGSSPPSITSNSAPIPANASNATTRK